MAEDTSVKFFTSDMPRAPQLVPNVLTSVTDIFKACLVNGFGSVTPTSASVTDGMCRVLVPDNSTFPLYSTISCSGADQSGFNGEHKVIRSAGAWFEFNTEMPNGAISGASISIKYASAGWVAPFGTTGTKTSFKSVSTKPKAKNFFFNLNEVAYNELRVRGYKSMTDNNTGELLLPDPGVYTGGLFWPRSYDNNNAVRKWAFLANDRFFYWFCAPYYSNTTGYPFVTVCFGDLYTDNVTNSLDVIISGLNSTDTANVSADYSNHQIGCSHTSVVNIHPIASDAVGITSSISGMFFSYAPGPYNSFLMSGLNGFSKFDPISNSYNLNTYHYLDANKITRGKVMGAYFLNTSLNRIADNFSVTRGTGDFANKNLFGVFTPSGAGYKHYNVNNYDFAYMYFDITGPWE